MNVKDLRGQRFGHLTVIRRSTRRNPKAQVFWVCKCDCGRLLVVRGDNLRRGVARQCSVCFRRGKSSMFVYEGEDYENKI